MFPVHFCGYDSRHIHFIMNGIQQGIQFIIMDIFIMFRKLFLDTLETLIDIYLHYIQNINHKPSRVRIL